MCSSVQNNAKAQPTKQSVLSLCAIEAVCADRTENQYVALTDAADAVSFFAYFYLPFFSYRFYFNQFHSTCKKQMCRALIGV